MSALDGLNAGIYQKVTSLNQKYLRGKGGSMVIFGIKGGGKAGSKFIDSLKLFSHLANVGDAKSLVIHPATTTHYRMSDEDLRKAGIGPGTRSGTDIIDLSQINSRMGDGATATCPPPATLDGATATSTARCLPASWSTGVA